VLKLHVDGQVADNWAAIGFDTNALKKLRRASPATQTSLLTFLESREVKTVLPAQGRAEYWNHHRAFANTVEAIQAETRKLAKRYDNLPSMAGASAALRSYAKEIDDLADDVGDTENEHLLKLSVEFWEVLLGSSIVADVPRSDFARIGQTRLACGVPPGFADERKRANGLGDFYVWADFLFGLLSLQLPAVEPGKSTIVFVTEDAKEDWIVSGVPHPTLLGEVNVLTGRCLRILGMTS